MSTLQASTMFLQYGDTPAGPFKTVVCLSQADFSGSATINSDETHCGILKGIGNSNNTFTGTLVLETVPTVDEGSYEELKTIYAGKLKKYWQLTNDDDSNYHGGYGWLSALGNQNASGQTSKATFTVDIDGDIDIVPTS